MITDGMRHVDSQTPDDSILAEDKPFAIGPEIRYAKSHRFRKLVDLIEVVIEREARNALPSTINEALQLLAMRYEVRTGIAKAKEEKRRNP